MAMVELAFSPQPRYVRTARLVGVAVARRAGVAEERLDDIRLAIGEACGAAVARHERDHTALVRVELVDDGPYLVRVIDAGSDGAGGDAEADGMTAALLTGLVDDLQVRSGADGTEVRMSWPVRRRATDGRRAGVGPA